MNKLRLLFSSSAEGARFRRKAAPFLGIAGFIVVVLLAAPPAWEYSNSTQFCGETCHTMPPEYQTYLVSPHARVPCVDCHIGRGLIIEQAFRKTEHMRLIWMTLTNSYEYPIHVSSMRPARDTCELCHFPEKFSDDSLRERQHYLENAENTPYSIYLLMHTGGGSAREGLGRGIHWHVENLVEYIATDDRDQEIPWVRVTDALSGAVTEFVDSGADFDLATLPEYEVKQMDCITCHNRISHYIETPRQIVESALRRGAISAAIPNIRYIAESKLALSYESSAEAAESISELTDFYSETYPDFYAENGELVAQAETVLASLWDENNYVEQELAWDTHPNNIGHRDWPGCFRCHDGEHTSTEDPQEAIRLECNLCHSVPQVVRPNVIEPMLPLTTGLEPESHLEGTWISRHHNEFDRSCANCHTVENPGGTSDTSFCSNSACHGVRWKFADFDAPMLALELGLLPDQPEEALLTDIDPASLTYADLQPLLDAECGACHGSNPTVGLRVTTYESLLAGSRNGPVMVPGSASTSPIVDVLDDGHFGALTSGQLVLLGQWIDAGAPEGDAIVPAAATYATLQPALVEACGECHGSDDPERELDVTTYEALMAGSRGGPVIEPGSPEASLILEVLNEGHFGQLSGAQLTTLHNWIAAGAPADDDAAAGLPAGEVPAARRVTFNDLLPVFIERCSLCHAGSDPAGGLSLLLYDDVIAGGRYGPVIVPGAPAESYILEILQEEHPGGLTTNHYLLLRQWIADGAPEE